MVPTHYRMVTLSGSHYQIGRQHGSQLRDLVHHHLEVVLDRLGRRSGVSHAEAMVGAIRYRPYVERHTPELAEEIRGVADGADIRLPVWGVTAGTRANAEVLRAVRSPAG